ncbi:serine/threonine-protein kinase [Streptomyces griseoviridis]|uniref:serine/threonine-protein kinase n=1 Tax=Streptomyces sp. MAA16 TaxID=3035116 RepID=UPI0024772AAB|nr:serine/threonine-protein kinase [Streptomyces sp. MAA16]MDH6698816.1 tRNA A-37 threonylcarbamoyl transferase component Bud32 [Streptomyces sp. MAA16]
MNSDGGAPRGQSDEPTSFALQPPGGPAAVPVPDNPYAVPAQPAAAPPAARGGSADPGSGRLIGGRYRLLDRLGHGGMGTVWRAQDETVDREVAVKEPRVPENLPERERSNAYERMRREARAAARLDHPAVVGVHDVAVVDGRPWIVMELVRGRSLGSVLQEGTLEAREAARIGLDVLGALEAAHAAGILHRDVKPDNVLLGRHGRVVLTDFGIAQIEGETDLTDTGGFVGSPEYIAPERVLGRRPGPASDLWSLGVVLYAATEGVSPFRRSNTPATLQSVLNAAPAPPAGAAGPLAEAIDGLLRKDPAHRPDAARVRALLTQAAHPPAPVPTQEVRVVTRGVRLGRGAWTAVGAAVVAAALVGYLVVADPFAGPLPDGWTERALGGRTGMSLAVPTAFTKEEIPDSDGTDALFSDPSGAVWIRVDRDIKAEDKNDEIPGTALEKAVEEWATVKGGRYSWDIAAKPAPVGKPQGARYRDRDAGENTIRYTTASSTTPRPREARALYYRAGNGDMYGIWIDYPGTGYFTEEGRAIATTALANWDVRSL